MEKKEEIKHLKEKLEFLQNGKTIGYLQYKVMKQQKSREYMDVYHTFVDEAGRGQGIAAKLCHAAFEYAQQQGWKVLPTCSYVRDTYLSKYPSHQTLVLE